MAPTVSAGPNGGAAAAAPQVTLTANEAGAQVYFTTDGLDPVDATGDPVPGAAFYTGAITIPATATLRFVAFDGSGNRSGTGSAHYVITGSG